MLPAVPRDALVQAVVQGMIVALGFAALGFTAIAALVGAFFEMRIKQDVSNLKAEIAGTVRTEVTSFLRKVSANVDYRLGYVEWLQSTLTGVSADAAEILRSAALISTQRAYDTLKQETLTDDKDISVMVDIRNNLAWYLADARIEKEAAMEHVHYLESAKQFYRNPTFLLTKAHVLLCFANTRDEALEVLKVYDLLQVQFGHLPEIAQKVAERRTRAEEFLKGLSQGP